MTKLTNRDVEGALLMLAGEHRGWNAALDAVNELFFKHLGTLSMGEILYDLYKPDATHSGRGMTIEQVDKENT